MTTPSPFSASIHPRQRGMSLVEIMVALVVGLILIAGVGQTFLSSKKTSDVQDARARLQENARFAISLLTRSIQEAGYLGCSNTAPLTNNLNINAGTGRHDYAYDYTYEALGYAADTGNPRRLPTIAAIYGFEWNAGAATSTTATNWAPTLDASITSPSPGSDVLTVRGPIGESLRLTANMAGTNADPTVGANTVLSQCDIVIVSDCASASVMQVTNANPQSAPGTLSHAATANAPCTTASGSNVNPGNATAALASAYQQGTDATPYGTTSFYVRTGAGTGNTEPALFRRVNGRDAEELVEGVEQIQIRYGEDTDALPAPTASPNTPDYTPNRYVTADQVTDWRRVVSVRISLLMRTRDDGIVTTPQTYQFNGATVTATDRRLRQVFTTTIGIRNRLP